MAFENIRAALLDIDAHLEEDLTVERVAERHHFSAFYFHRMFTAIVGCSLASYIRRRRIEKACRLIAQSDAALTDIGLSCGFGSQQAFNRAFKRQTGYAPGVYRRLGLQPSDESVEDMIMRFTNRLKGGMIVKPNIIKRGKLRIAGITGDGNKTGQVWMDFEKAVEAKGLPERLSQNGYELRFTKADRWMVHVGYAVPEGARVDEAFHVMDLPASIYASFDVYVAKGYHSENQAMDEWLHSNEEGYRVRLLDDEDYVVEYYDERFHGEAADSIVEIWVPVQREGR